MLSSTKPTEALVDGETYMICSIGLKGSCIIRHLSKVLYGMELIIQIDHNNCIH